MASLDARLAQKEERALTDIVDFARKKPCYVGVSWGKDSTVLAHLVWRCLPTLMTMLPTVWVRVRPISNPDCEAVESAYLERCATHYRRVDVVCTQDLLGWHATGTLDRGFAEASAWAGAARYISGVRAEESGARKIRARTWGPSTERTLAPLIWWTQGDVFAYLAKYDLPVHPAYAMLGCGRWDRRKIRVASLGGQRGAERGRAEWEKEYYGDVLARLEAQA